MVDCVGFMTRSLIIESTCHDDEGDTMKTTAALSVLLIGLALGYLLGTDSGREKRELILVKLGRGDDVTDDVDDVIADIAE